MGSPWEDHPCAHRPASQLGNPARRPCQAQHRRALAFAPVLDRGLRWFTVKFNFKLEGKGALQLLLPLLGIKQVVSGAAGPAGGGNRTWTSNFSAADFLVQQFVAADFLWCCKCFYQFVPCC